MTEPAGPTPDRFRAVMGRFVTGITIMSAVAADGQPHGMTANAITSVSLTPPLVLACVDRSAIMADVMEEAQGFALSFLRADQEEVSQWFADSDRPVGAAQFDGVPTLDRPTIAPVLADALAWVDCRTWAIYDGGDHLIVVGEVVDLGETDDPDAAPLLYDRGGYAQVREGRDVADLPD